jgi:hypothetical protein
VSSIDLAGFITDVKGQAIHHGFHVHDERHFMETYSLRQWWEVDLHPESGCGSPVELHLALDVDPRVLLAFEDALTTAADSEAIPDEFFFPLTLTWTLPAPEIELLNLALDLAGLTGMSLPLEVAATDSYGSPAATPERVISVTARRSVSLTKIIEGEETIVETLKRANDVSLFLLNLVEQ